MEITISTLSAAIALISASYATYNAYLLRGGALALSQILVALGMISLMFSLIVARFLPGLLLLSGISAGDVLFVAGFILLFLASVRFRVAFK